MEFSELWDRLQNDGRCCGIIGPQVTPFILVELFEHNEQRKRRIGGGGKVKLTRNSLNANAFNCFK